MDSSFYLSVMSRAQRWQFRSLVALWMTALLWFWIWWFRQDHIVTVLGLALNSILLAMTTVLPGYYFIFVSRMRIANPNVPPPRGTYAMVVTKAPSEPWSIVRTTLIAMLNQEFPYSYYVWLATEKLDEEIRLWCEAWGVGIVCRDGVAGYQNETFPGRQRCKEGNLRYFYDVVGYQYDFVVQLDADHVPTPTYLVEIVRPFADPDIGYVAAPSICDANSAASWTVRARLWLEASMHGPLQAGYTRFWAPMPIGSHYAVRTVALRSLVHKRGGKVAALGGLGPELAEDHTTGLAMNACRRYRRRSGKYPARTWRGAFALNAIAHGDGAVGFASSMTQEFQWARSLMNVLLIWTRGYWPGLPLRLKFQYLFAQTWYPLYALLMAGGFVLPIIALISGQPWVNVPLVEFIFRSGVLTAACLAIVAWIRRQGWLRPAKAPILSWEMVLFGFVRWPWVLIACIHSIMGVVLRKELQFKVTPKGVTGPQPLPLVALLPMVGIVIAYVGTAIAINDAGKANGYFYFSLTNGFIYLVALLSVIFLHVRENWAGFGRSLKLVGTPLSYATLLTICVVFAFMLRAGMVVHNLLGDSTNYASALQMAVHIVR